MFGKGDPSEQINRYKQQLTPGIRIAHGSRAGQYPCKLNTPRSCGSWGRLRIYLGRTQSGATTDRRGACCGDAAPVTARLECDRGQAADADRRAETHSGWHVIPAGQLRNQGGKNPGPLQLTIRVEFSKLLKAAGLWAMHKHLLAQPIAVYQAVRHAGSVRPHWVACGLVQIVEARDQMCAGMLHHCECIEVLCLVLCCC